MKRVLLFIMIVAVMSGSIVFGAELDLTHPEPTGGPVSRPETIRDVKPVIRQVAEMALMGHMMSAPFIEKYSTTTADVSTYTVTVNPGLMWWNKRSPVKRELVQIERIDQYDIISQSDLYSPTTNVAIAILEIDLGASSSSAGVDRYYMDYGWTTTHTEECLNIIYTTCSEADWLADATSITLPVPTTDAYPLAQIGNRDYPIRYRVTLRTSDAIYIDNTVRWSSDDTAWDFKNRE